ncbi:MAG: hypothetical protein IJ047_06320 [Paludibacteraceae bacterium]|nr:hypothetical protein [Paludibacteraceae bacterium]MBR1878193.1 hypothetical protein [Paludibacteraceae bacterium]
MKKIYVQPRIETVATTPQQMLCASGGIKAQISGYKKNTGSGFSQTFVWLAGIVCSSLLFLGTACSTTNNPDQPKQQAELKPRTLVVKTSPQPSPQERGILRLPQATITENGDALDAIWSAGDEISFRNMSHASYTDPQTQASVYLDGVLLADRSASIASFASNAKVWCALGDKILLVYPKATAPAISVEGDPLRATYTISLADQNGTLGTIASTYHHSYGIATITEVTPTVANAELAEMQNLLTVCKFSFVDGSNQPLTITSLSISYNGGDYAGTYPETARVTVTQGTNSTATVTPDNQNKEAEGDPLTIAPDGNPEVVYVALFPEANATEYSFTVTSGEDTYTGTATARLNAGEFVVATNLKLTIVNP